MTAAPEMHAATVAERSAATHAASRPHWIDDWDPEDPRFWAEKGSKIAGRNLIFSIFSEHIGFSIWTMWSTLILFLGPKYGFNPNAPGHTAASVAADKFLLVSVPAAVGSALRLPYTFAVAKFGGRNWTIVSAALLLLPTVLLALMLHPGHPSAANPKVFEGYTSFGMLIFLGAVAGVGGGNFASSMANINNFYPSRLKGWALGLNAAGGNLGVATIQLVGLWVLATKGVDHPKLVVGVYIPLIAIAALCAALFMDNITGATNEKGAMREVCKDPHTWIMSFLYIGTFGSFIGFSFAFGQLLTVQFPTHFPKIDPVTHKAVTDAVTHKGIVDAVKVAHWTYLGPLIGSLSRPIGGFLADRLGGAKVTFWNFVAMALFATLALTASEQKSFGLAIAAFTGLFLTAGLGNGSTYKMIPTIFGAKATMAVSEGQDPAGAQTHARRMSGALIGIAGAIGAGGGVLVNIAFRQSFLHTKSGNDAYVAFLAFYAVCFVLTWAVYLRPGRRLETV
ncbi:MAG TPA: MFS transporter [Sporichthyaceae bacterium]|jgi:NNP family nitrate/nitrite transporter-like MFS transporter